ncbi:MAG: DUF4124 domain-containing protein [Cellvibrionaceae bacterium]|nr:DUF4124 domain-containing protein [Cellvibrionaceae bacterium]
MQSTRTNKPLLAIALGIALLGGSLSSPELSAAKKFYKWVDKDGVVHYSATPPKGQKAELITTLTGRSSTPVKQKPAETKAEKKATEAIAEPAKDPALCKRAQRNLKVLESNHRVRIKGEDGNLSMLSHEQKQKQIDAAKKVIDQHCGR